MLVCISFVHGAHETAGAARIRHSLRPLIYLGARFPQSPGASRRGIAKSCLLSTRHARAKARSASSNKVTRASIEKDFSLRNGLPGQARQ
jgi:hypothetical protein